MECYDVHATALHLLHLLGLGHERLTDVHDRVLSDLIA